MTLNSTKTITRYFTKTNLHTQQKTLEKIITKILKNKHNLNRKSLYTKLLYRLKHTTKKKKQKHYNTLIKLLFK